MKKIVLSALLATTCIFAVDVEPYIGLNIGFANTELDVQATNLTNSKSASASVRSHELAFGISGGAILNNNHRVSLNYTNSSGEFESNGAEIEGDLDLFLVNYDYLFTLGKATPSLHPYIGINVGYADVEGLDSDIAYGINLGLIQNINETVSFELGYKFTYLDASSTETGSILGNPVSATAEVESAHNVFVAVNYKF